MEDLPAIKKLLVGIFLILLFGVIFFARDLLLPIVMALLLSLTLSPVVRALSRLGVPAPLSAVVLIFGAGILLFSGIYLLSTPVTEMLSDLPAMAEALREKLAGMIQSMEDMQNTTDQVEALATGADEGMSTVAVEQPGFLVFAAGSVANFLSLSAVALVLSLFILASGDLFYTKMVESAPTFSGKRKTVKAMRDIERQISRYFLTITVINAALGVCIAAAMWVVGMPSPVLWGAMAFALNYLPFVGALMGGVTAAAIGLLSFDGLGAGLLPAGVYLCITTLEGQFLTPSVLGRRLELNTVSVLLTVIIWSWLWSIPGALMAVPFLVLLKVASDNIPSWQTFGNFLSARNIVLPPDDEPAGETPS